MHIALIYSRYEDLVEEATKLNPHGAVQMKDTVMAIAEGLEASGHKVTKIEATNALLNTIHDIETPDVIFNLSAGITNKRSQANIVGMLEMTGIPFVGSGLSTHVLGLHKEITKILLRENGVRTARSQLFTDGEEEIREDFVFPVIVKPEHEGSSVGITDSSKVNSKEELRDVVKEKMEIYNQVILVEEFLPGREFTMGVMGNLELEVLPIKEYLFEEDGEFQYLTVEAKADDLVPSKIPADISDELKKEMEEMAKKAFRALRCQDLARIDFRLDREGKPNVIELNTLPGMQKGYSDFPTTAEAAGYSYEELLNKLVNFALSPRGKQ
ncbi:MAG: ATP-grasp domain-containing protein [Tissierellia bacterium]|jgi:D-alanine-D-alanine ligase|nr:ATP-grasp domain-containing protein [Tissierellia bacterium]